MISETELASLVATLFSMMNPIGNVGVFAGLTTDRTASEVRRIAATSALAIAITLLVVTWSGSFVMKFFGLTVDTLRAAGGIIVLLIGLHMLFNKSEHKHTAAELEDAKSNDSIAVVPMAIPIVAGPGTMATVLVAAQNDPSVLSKAAISVVVIVLSGLCCLLFSFAKPI
ncbi:MAG: NAAT family transporter, partial [Planctomycetales bacterium]|nr:NAAT family transporter [Planctomycetales bacterium]